MADDPAANLALNIKQLREARGLTQHQISKVAGLPRPTWANLESGAANPTLSVLMKVATALQVSLEELVGPPRAVARLYRATELPQRRKGKVCVRKLLPDPIAGMELERMELPEATLASTLSDLEGWARSLKERAGSEPEGGAAP